MPGQLDFGPQRVCWLAQVVTDWMGDDAWLWKLRVQHRGFNYIGDSTWLRGHVSKKYVVDGHHAVDLDVHCENQHGRVTSPATAAGFCAEATLDADCPGATLVRD